MNVIIGLILSFKHSGAAMSIFYTNKYILSLTIVLISFLTVHSMQEQDREALMGYMGGMQNWRDFETRKKIDLPFPLYLTQAIQSSPNKLKFKLAHLILAKIDYQKLPEIGSHVKEIIADSFWPLKLYKKNILVLESTDQWLNLKNSEQNYKIYENDIDILFQSYDLPDSKKYYDEFNSMLYAAKIISPVQKSIYGESQIPTELILFKCKQAEEILIASLSHELQTQYGLQFKTEYPFNCTFKAILSTTPESERKLGIYIHQKLSTIEEKNHIQDVSSSW